MSWFKKLSTRKKYAFNPDYTVRPSQTILEAMEFSRVTTTILWARTDMICSTIAKLLADEIKIHEWIATDLSRVLGSTPEFWMELSKNYFEKKGGSDV